MRAVPAALRNHVAAVSRFGLTGVFTALIDIAMLATLIGFDFPLAGAVTLGFATGLVANFWLHKLFTYGDRSTPSLQQITRFLLIAAANYLQTVLVVLLAVRYISVSPLVAKLVSLPGVVLVGYWCAGKYVFARGGRDGVPV